MWPFAPSAAGTHIEWTFTVTLRSAFALPLVWALRPFMRAAMKECLARIAATFGAGR